MIHWIIERAKDGTPLRMWWSSQAQRQAEKEHREYCEKVRLATENNGLPMPSMREWARKRGII